MKLDYPRKGGSTHRASQQQVRKTLGHKPKNWINDPVIWASGERLWSVYWELDSARHGLEPINYTEIMAYQSAVGVFLNPMDVRCIKAMDNARIKTTNEVSSKNG